MPINESYQIKKEEAKTYPPLPKNIYQVELLDIEEREAKGKFSQPGDTNFSFQFTLLEGNDGGENLRGRNVWNNFVPTSLYIGKKGKNALWQIVEAYLGRELTQREEVEGLTGDFLNSFIGKQIKVFIDHNLGSDKKTLYNNITSYMPVVAFLPALTPEEKDKATVKNRKQEPIANDDDEQSGHVEDSEININELPF